MHAFSFKLLWRFRKNKSLWSLHMHNRYCRGEHLTNVALVNNSTNVWKRIWKIRHEVEPYLHWIIGKRDIDVSLDGWMDDYMPLLNDRILDKALFLNDKEINEYSIRLLGNVNSELIKKAKISLAPEEDRWC